MKKINFTKTYVKRTIAMFLAVLSVIGVMNFSASIEADAASPNDYYTSIYFPRYTGYSGSIVTGLNSVGVESSYSYRSKIAVANGISGYRGTADQNTHMLNLLKQGRLIRPDAAHGHTHSLKDVEISEQTKINIAKPTNIIADTQSDIGTLYFFF